MSTPHTGATNVNDKKEKTSPEDRVIPGCSLGGALSFLSWNVVVNALLQEME